MHLQAPNAEQLMRSRYTAYVINDMVYVRDTWHPLTRSAALVPGSRDVRWLGLEIRRHEEAEGGRHATVEFVARYKDHGRAYRLHEISRFERLDGQWFYVDGSTGLRAPRRA